MTRLYEFDTNMKKLIEQAVIPFAVYQYADGKVHVLLVSDGLCRLAGMPRAEFTELLQNNMYVNVHPDDVYAIAQAAHRFATEGGELNVMYRECVAESGHYEVLHVVGRHIYTRDGVRLAVVQYDNVTTAMSSTEEVKMVFESAVEEYYSADPHAICVISREQSRVRYSNQAYQELVPPLMAYDSNINYWVYFHGREYPEFEDYFHRHCGKGPFISMELDEGRPLSVLVRENVWAGEEVYVIEVETVEEAYADELTGLPNQAYYELKAPIRLKMLASEGNDAELIFFDMVNLKLYNAQHGYEQGDRLLHEFARLLMQEFEGALITHVDSDHFSVISAGRDLCQILPKLQDKLDKLGRSRVEIKAGIRKVPAGTELTAAVLLDQAKIACESIRLDAEHSYRYYDEDLEKQLQDHKFVNDNIDKAIAAGEIQVYYQPVIRTLDRKLCGYEALARWVSPELGFLPPFRFIPALEESHQIHKLDCHIIEEICRQYQKDREAGLPVVPISFNLSRLDFQMCDIFGYIQEMTEKYQVPHSAMHVEITETLFSDDTDGLVHQAIADFHEAGYEVWMDDFGSGYSSLNSLKDYSFDQLKIDMEFLRTFNERSRKIIRSIIQMAKSLGIHTLAEGVETEEHYEFLCSVGCEKVQGYFFGKPLPIRESEEQVRSKGVGAESTEDAEFYAEAGIRLEAGDEPFAIMEMDQQHMRYLYMNRKYQTVFERIGLESPARVISALETEESVLLAETLGKLALAEENGGEIHYAYNYHGHYLTIFMKILKREGDRICIHQILSTTVIESEIPETKPAGHEESVESKERKTILIVDDEPINFMMLSEMLRNHYNIIYAENGAKAMEAIEESRGTIAAVLLDMVMPVMSGLEVLHRLRSDDKTRLLPVLVMTSASDMEHEAMKQGASQFLSKPFEAPDVVLAKVQSSIERANRVFGYTLRSMENLPGGSFIYQADGQEKILHATQQLLDMFECRDMDEFNDLTGGTFRGMVLEDDYHRVHIDIQKQTAGRPNQNDHVRYRIRTRSGKIKMIDEFGKMVEDPIMGRVYYVFVGESSYFGESEESMRFDEFLHGGEHGGSEEGSIDYKSYLLWNLSQNTPLISQRGVHFLSEEKLAEFSYEDYYNYMVGHAHGDERRRRMEEYGRDRLLKRFDAGERVDDLVLNYRVSGRWINVSAAFDMMRDPKNGDIYLKVQNQNGIHSDVYERILTMEYVTITELDFPTETIRAIKLYAGTTEDVVDALANGSYEVVRQALLNEMVEPAYREDILRQTELSRIREALQHVLQYSLFFRGSHGGYVEMKIVRADGDPSREVEHVLIAFANRDEMVRESPVLGE